MLITTEIHFYHINFTKHLYKKRNDGEIGFLTNLPIVSHLTGNDNPVRVLILFCELRQPLI